MIDKDFDNKQVAQELDNLRNEAATLYRCKHPSIIRCIEFVDLEDLMFLVMEYKRGSDILKCMERQNLVTLDEERLHSMAVKIAEGISYLHNKGIIHRDIKSENILLSSEAEDAEPVICDFGFATRLLNGK